MSDSMAEERVGASSAPGRTIWGDTGRREITAAVLRKAHGPFTLEQLTLEEPRPDEVVVKLVATGVCHTDASVRSQEIGLPLPIVLGHEGAGIVVGIGSAVTKVEVGDHVVMTFASCGACSHCRTGTPTGCDHHVPLNFGCSRPDGSHAVAGEGEAINDRFFGQSSFATYTVAAEHGVVKVDKGAPLKYLGALGCGIQTGAGAVLNVFRPGVGDSLVVFGCGTVGLAAIMAARVAGLSAIIAVDMLDSRLSLALELGATHCINSGRDDALGSIRGMAGKGIDFSLDTTGRPEVIRTAIQALGARGTCGVLGAMPQGIDITIEPYDFILGSKRLVGIVEGDSMPDLFIPRMIALFKQGRFPIDRLMSFYPMDRINDAFEDSKNGVAVKAVLEIGT